MKQWTKNMIARQELRAAQRQGTLTIKLNLGK